MAALERKLAIGDISNVEATTDVSSGRAGHFASSNCTPQASLVPD